MAKQSVMIVAPDQSTVSAVQALIQDQFEVSTALWTTESLLPIHEQASSVMLLDIDSPSQPSAEDGLNVLQQLRQTGYVGKVIAYTGRPERSVAVRAIQCGACDVLAKSADGVQLQQSLERVARVADLEQEARGAMLVGWPEEFSGMLGMSASINRIFDAIRKVSTSDAPILITGESGTGKELTARAIHARGVRRQGPFIPINCGAIPESLLESELFGYERGAFTGAVGQKKGKVEFAQGGTLFLDEVGDLPNALQVKLLRFLQDHTFERVGGHQAIEMNVRIIAATNVNLKDAIEKGTFREDLYYRLGVVHINLPPLRERGEDVSLIAMAFLRQAASHYHKPLYGFTREALEAMQAYSWPGNVRELSNRIGRAVVMAEGTHVTAADLDLPRQAAPQDDGSISLKVNQQRIETDLIMKAFTLSQGNLSRAAQELGISRSTLYRRLRQYGMERSLEARRFPGVSPRASMTEH
ncbi:MAG: sigma-54-dependent Fis family transcriptional regulator [Nitrospira sp.]|nr:sigma-54-dependent Fis family transcriptional regulator [Nitrospira sp.]